MITGQADLEGHGVWAHFREAHYERSQLDKPAWAGCAILVNDYERPAAVARHFVDDLWRKEYRGAVIGGGQVLMPRQSSFRAFHAAQWEATYTRVVVAPSEGVSARPRVAALAALVLTVSMASAVLGVFLWHLFYGLLTGTWIVPWGVAIWGIGLSMALLVTIAAAVRERFSLFWGRG